MMDDIRGLSSDERVHKLVLETSLRHSVLGQYQQPTGLITDNDLYDIFSKIEHRTYYTVDMPKFEIVDVLDGQIVTTYKSCETIVADDIETLANTILTNAEEKYFIYYNISLAEMVPGRKQYSIRGVFMDDPAMKRDKKINIILGE